MSLADAIPDGATVLLDTNPLIYVFEGSRLGAPFREIVRDIDAGRILGLITPITLAEILAGPLKAGKEDLAARYRQALTSGGYALREIDADIAMLAARLRLRHRLLLPDAIQLATALHEGCHALVTHDRDFGAVEGLAILGQA